MGRTVTVAPEMRDSDTVGRSPLVREESLFGWLCELSVSQFVQPNQDLR